MKNVIKSLFVAVIAMSVTFVQAQDNGTMKMEKKETKMEKKGKNGKMTKKTTKTTVKKTKKVEKEDEKGMSK